MKQVFLITALALINLVAQAQTTVDSVKAAINLLFDGMKTADAAKINGAFADSALLQSISVGNDGKVVIKNQAVAGFAMAISKMGKGDADERIQFDNIKIDGPLASVWTPYKFYYKGVLNHCGVDSYQLVRLNGTWKIQYLIDTRRQTLCE